MKVIRAFNNFTIPFVGGWPIHEAGYLCGDKPRIFWRGRGWFSYKTTGPKAWTALEIPDPPKEPDNRFEWNHEAYTKWYPEWVAYATEYGLPAAAGGTLCCEYSIERYVLQKFTNRYRYPPADMLAAVETLTGVDPCKFETLPLFVMSAPYSLDIIGLLRHLMRTKGVDFEHWNSSVEQSARQWIAEQFGEPAAAAVEKLLHWRIEPESEERYMECVRDLCLRRDEAMATCRPVKK